jgi:ABC-2 type transport system permease protein
VTGLVRSEVLRFTSRRLFRTLGVLVVAGLLAAAVIAFLQSSKDPNAGLADARRIVAECERHIAELPPEEREGGGFLCPRVEGLTRDFDKRFVYADLIPDASRGVAIVFFLLAFAVAASFVGADWGSGSLTTLLTWEPRRGRVLAAKTIAATALLTVVVAVALALLAVVFLPVAALRGTLDGVDGSLWWTLAGIWLRGAVLAVFASVAGAGLATITRNTAGAIGIAFGYALVLDNLLGVIRGGRLRPWLLQHLLPRMVGLTAELQEPGDFGPSVRQSLTAVRPVIVLTMYGLAIMTAAYVSFRARDVS